jgi:hypothetical protein
VNGHRGQRVTITQWVGTVDTDTLVRCLLDVACEVPMSTERRRAVLREAARRLNHYTEETMSVAKVEQLEAELLEARDRAAYWEREHARVASVPPEAPDA